MGAIGFLAIPLSERDIITVSDKACTGGLEPLCAIFLLHLALTEKLLNPAPFNVLV